MTPYYDEGGITIYHGDCLEVLPTLGRVGLLITDPPYGINYQSNHRVPTGESFSDCDHNDWRPGLVLDPFGGSGTTALVATGHGRDCILIDLDERNYELALQRVGPFILERAG